MDNEQSGVNIDTPEINTLKQLSFNIREKIIRLATSGGCFLGASLSCVEILIYLYKKFLNTTPENINSEKRDYFFLSKGHDVPALYSIFTELGFIPEQRLKNHLSTSDLIYWHPNREIPGVEFHSGSLGHNLSVASGVAYDIKISGKDNKVVVLLGDGELNEGSVWESVLVASALKLNNLIAVIDRNHFQANVRSESLIPLEPLESKFEAFGWDAYTCDGHDYLSLDEAFTSLNFNHRRPSVIIAETVRGKGLPSIEERADRWFCNFSGEEIESLINELYSASPAHLSSESLIVR